jgi:hypothetical protein
MIDPPSVIAYIGGNLLTVTVSDVVTCNVISYFLTNLNSWLRYFLQVYAPSQPSIGINSLV